MYTLNKAFVMLIIISLLLAGCLKQPDKEVTTDNANIITTNNKDHDNSTSTNSDVEHDNSSSNNIEDSDSSDSTTLTTVTLNEVPTQKDLVTEILSSLTLEEKIAQLFIVDFYGMTNTYQVKEFNQDIQEFLLQYPVSGIIYFSENIVSIDQLSEFNNQLQVNSPLPLFIAIDEEGGLVSRLGAADIGIDRLDSATKLANNFTVEEVYEKAFTLGKQIQSAGFNYDFAPVFDINTNPNNPVIGNRAFSNDSLIVSNYGVAFSTGLNDSGVISSGKHFPGHGDTLTDSHLGLASIPHNIDRLYNEELIPFTAAINSNIPSIMIGHITAPNIDNTTPASLSKYFITELLRDELGYDGLVISDSFRMQAITDYYSPESIGVEYLKAGGDIILIPSDFKATYNGLLEAVTNGDLSEERIDESLRRILQTKLDYQILH